jgi:hypothetical protein
MLFDDILEAAIPTKGRSYTPGLITVLRTFGQQIARSPRYVLTEDMVWVTEQIAESKPSTFTKGLPLCRLPHPVMWLELPFVFRQNFRAANHPADYHAPFDAADKDFAPPPATIGFLLEEVGERMIQVTHAWVHRDGAVNICIRGMLISTGPDLLNPPESLETSKREMDKSPHSWAARHTRTAADLAALNELYCRLDTVGLPIMDPYMRELYHAARGNPATLAKYDAMADYDLLGEWRFVLASLMMLNSRNILDYQEVDRSKLNKARAKNPRKPPALDYHMVNFRISRVARNAGKAHGMTNEELKKHMVQGHPKVRRTGVFWWSPFIRGYQGEVTPPTYIVRP